MSAAAHLLSVDMEDYFQTEAFSATAPRETWGQYPLRVERNTKRLLDLFDTHDAKATFFVLGWIADRTPALVREIAQRGHELACHSYWHRPIYSLTPREFRDDTRAAVQAIEDAASVRVTGYRAPTWSITRDSMWALQVLAEEGFEYDSSIFPIRHDLYGIPGALKTPYVWRTGEHELAELPPATLSMGPMTLPAAGGGYLRIFPLSYTRLAIDRIARGGERAVIYLHPWEIDPEQPRLQGRWKSRFRQYRGLKSLEHKLAQLLEDYRFTTLGQVWRASVSQRPYLVLSALETATAQNVR